MTSRPELFALLRVLATSHIDSGTVWLWLVTPTPLLSGEIPGEVARSEPARALRAAVRFAARGGY